MKYEFIRTHCKRFPVARLCRVLAVSRSGFHAWLTRPASERVKANRQLLIAIRRVHVEHREAYGGVKTWRTLNERGIACGNRLNFYQNQTSHALYRCRSVQGRN